MNPNFFLYARKSSESEERQALSIESQLAELKTFAERERLNIVQTFTESQSAKIPGRPIFNQMIAQIEKGEANGIISWHPDRLARNSIDGGRLVYLLDTNHLQFLKFPTFWFENTPQGKFMLNIAFGQSKYYVDNLSENVRRGQRQKIRRGEWPGWAPLGYVNDKNSRKVIPDKVNAPLVRQLFETYATGSYTFPELQKASFQWGLMSRKDKPLVKAEIQRTLKRSFYYGLMIYKGEAHQGTHEPLITKETFDRVQKVMAQMSRPKKVKHVFPYLGLAKCAACGCAITAERQKGFHYYRCTKKKGPCRERYTREESLTEQINEFLVTVALPPEGFDVMSRWLAEDRQSADSEVAAQKEKIENNKNEIGEKLDKLLDAHLSGLIDKDEFFAKKSRLLNEKIKLEENLTKLEQGALWLEPLGKMINTAHQAHLATLSDDPATKLRMAEKCGSNALLGGRRLTLVPRKPWGIFAENFLNFVGFAAGGAHAPECGTAAPDAQNARHLAKWRKR